MCFRFVSRKFGLLWRQLLDSCPASSWPALCRPSTPRRLSNEADLASPGDEGPMTRNNGFGLAASLAPFRRVECVDGRADPRNKSGDGHDPFRAAATANAVSKNP